MILTAVTPDVIGHLKPNVAKMGRKKKTSENGRSIIEELSRGHHVRVKLLPPSFKYRY